MERETQEYLRATIRGYCEAQWDQVRIIAEQGAEIEALKEQVALLTAALNELADHVFPRTNP